jgi:hypothetical protein
MQASETAIKPKVSFKGVECLWAEEGPGFAVWATLPPPHNPPSISWGSSVGLDVTSPTRIPSCKVPFKTSLEGFPHYLRA